MHGGRRRNDCFGYLYREGAGGLTGLGRIGGGEQLSPGIEGLLGTGIHLRPDSVV